MLDGEFAVILIQKIFHTSAYLIRGIFHVFGQLFIEIIFEFFIKGSGHMLITSFTKYRPKRDSFIVAFVGILFYFVLIIFSTFLYQTLA